MEYVKFNSGEDLVIAGSQSGTLKIWDLEAAKSKFGSFYRATCPFCMSHMSIDMLAGLCSGVYLWSTTCYQIYTIGVAGL